MARLPNTIIMKFEPRSLEAMVRLRIALEEITARLPAPKVKKAKKAKEPKKYSQWVNELFDMCIPIFSGNGFNPPSDMGWMVRQKDALRLMIDADNVSAFDIKKGLEFLRDLPDASGKGFPGWGKVIGSFVKFRKKWNDEECGFRRKVLDAKSGGASIDDGKTVTEKESGY